MEFQSIQNAIDLLGPAPPPPPSPPTPSTEVRPPEQQPGGVEPKLEIAWGGFHQGFWSSVAALFGSSGAKAFRDASAFRDSWVEGRVPKRAVVAAALWHAAFLALPFSLLTCMPHTNPLLPPAHSLLNLFRTPPASAPFAQKSKNPLRPAHAAPQFAQHPATTARRCPGQATPAHQRSNAHKPAPQTKAPLNGDRNPARRHPQY